MPARLGDSMPVAPPPPARLAATETRQLSCLSPRARILVVYDGWCGVCTRAVELLLARDRARCVSALPSQTPGLREDVGLSQVQTDRAVWVIDASGRRFSGAAAVNRALWELGDGWRVLARLYRVPLLRWAERRGYAWVAAHRGSFSRFGALPTCERPGTLCLPDGA